MNSKRLYFILASVVGLLAIGLIGGAFGANAILQSQAQTVIKARSKSMALEQQQTQLAKAKASITKYQEIGKIAKAVVPQDKDQAQTVREIVKIAGEHGISLGAITFPSSSLGTTAGGAKSNLSQLKAAPGITGVYTLQITVQSATGSNTTYNQFVEFLSALERNRRTALVSAISLQPDTKDPNRVSFTLTIDEYIKDEAK
jgi:hypothetical protein